MPTKPVGGGDPVLLYGRPAYRRPGRRLLIANTDTVNPIYHGDQPGLDTRSSKIPPLGSVGFDGESDIYASSLVPGLTLVADLIPGGLLWAASPADIQKQLQPSIKVAQTSANAAGSFTIVTFGGASRIWAIFLGYSVATGSTFSGGPSNSSGTVTGSTLGVILSKNTLIAAANQSLSDIVNAAIDSPIPVPASSSVSLNVGSLSAGMSVSYDATVLYSTP